MRFRFTIRDLLWLTALIAMGVAWWVDHRSIQRQSVIEFNDLRETLYRVVESHELDALIESDSGPAVENSGRAHAHETRNGGNPPHIMPVVIPPEKTMP